MNTVTAVAALVLAGTVVFQQDGQCGCNVPTWRVREPTVAVAKHYFSTVCVSVVLPTQHAKLLHRLTPTSSSAACPLLPFFSTLSHK